MTREYNGFTWTDNYSHYLDKQTNSWVAASTAKGTGSQSQPENKGSTTTQYDGSTWTSDGMHYLDVSTNKWVKATAQWKTGSASASYTSSLQTFGTTIAGMNNSPFQNAPNPAARALGADLLMGVNRQTPGQPATPYVPLEPGFVAASAQSDLFGPFVRAYHKMVRGEV